MKFGKSKLCSGESLASGFMYLLPVLASCCSGLASTGCCLFLVGLRGGIMVITIERPALGLATAGQQMAGVNLLMNTGAVNILRRIVSSICSICNGASMPYSGSLLRDLIASFMRHLT